MGTPLSLVLTSTPQAVVEARIGGPARSPENCPALTDGRRAVNAEGGVSFYEIMGSTLDATQMGVALVGAGTVPSIRDGVARMNMEHDGHTQVFTACAASEGIRFAVWNDQPYQGEPRWSAYYYLGVDMEPNCPR
jgi:hypothetical protein